MENLNQICKKISDQTEANDHTGAKITIAKFFIYRDYLQIFQCIELLHQIDGSLSSELSEYRRRKGIEMMQRIKDYHGIKVYNKINKAL